MTDSNEQGEALKACPFCADTLIEVRGNEWDEDFRATCIGCLASSGRYRTKAEAIKAWNTRASVAAGEGDALLTAMWDALKREACKVPDEAQQIVFLSKGKFRKAMAPFAAASSPAPAEPVQPEGEQEPRATKRFQWEELQRLLIQAVVDQQPMTDRVWSGRVVITTNSENGTVGAVVSAWIDNDNNDEA